MSDHIQDQDQTEFRAHSRTYRGFLRLLVWIAAHLALLLFGLYFAFLQSAPFGGGFLIAVALVVLITGIIRTYSVASE